MGISPVGRTDLWLCEIAKLVCADLCKITLAVRLDCIVLWLDFTRSDNIEKLRQTSELLCINTYEKTTAFFSNRNKSSFSQRIWFRLLFVKSWNSRKLLLFYLMILLYFSIVLPFPLRWILVNNQTADKLLNYLLSTIYFTSANVSIIDWLIW